ncbi:MAG: hypothetical protein PHS93_09925 [Candidatus Omnitrophica bacterium]|nr:hypothetical protein [Candidatus Omnitrophota bacterium]MDD5353467.1 hypothetical protein [Candidatus Omnitrophota bacterium]
MRIVVGAKLRKIVMQNDIYLNTMRDPRFPGIVMLTEADWGKVLVGLSRSSIINFLPDKAVAPNKILEAVEQSANSSTTPASKQASAD